MSFDMDPADDRFVLDQCLDEIKRLKLALERINDVRNSIVGYQGFNFSMHAYPLVAALDAAGIEGMPFEQARAQLAIINAKIQKWNVDANAELEAKQKETK